jgi:hypothetical protein
MKRFIAVTLAAASLSFAALPTFADPDFYWDVAPPATPNEAVPAPRAGFVWVPGYYDHDAAKYQWRPGHWESERKGYMYRNPAWEHREGHYYYREGGWDHSPG